MNPTIASFQPLPPAIFRALIPFCLALLLLAVASPASQAVFRYIEQTGDDSVTFFWQAEASRESTVITQRQGDETYTSRCTPDGATVLWRYLRLPDTDIRVERRGHQLHFSGRLAAKPVTKVLDIDDRPWFQPLSYSLQRLVMGNQRQATFWTIRPDTLDVVAMQAEVAGSEAITPADETRSQLAHKVVIRPDGILAPFWQAEYWFRQDDHLFVQYRGTHGPPGTAETVISLVTP